MCRERENRFSWERSFQPKDLGRRTMEMGNVRNKMCREKKTGGFYCAHQGCPLSWHFIGYDCVIEVRGGGFEVSDFPAPSPKAHSFPLCSTSGNPGIIPLNISVRNNHRFRCGTLICQKLFVFFAENLATLNLKNSLNFHFNAK